MCRWCFAGLPKFTDEQDRVWHENSLKTAVLCVMDNEPLKKYEPSQAYDDLEYLVRQMHMSGETIVSVRMDQIYERLRLSR